MRQTSKILSILLAAAMLLPSQALAADAQSAANPAAVQESSYTAVETSDTRVEGFYNDTAALKAELAGRYNSGAMSEDGGSLEIVQYNAKNGFAYAVSGVKGKLIAVDLNDKLDGDKVVSLTGTEYDVKGMVRSYGDMTSVAVSPDGTRLAVAIQSANYDDQGSVALFACNDDGSLEALSTVKVGVQPDMLTFADNDTILTADEGEPREGKDATDPKGSVTILTIHPRTSKMTANSVYFDQFDAQRDALTKIGVLIQKDTQPSTDFEPEYITVNGRTAYVALQEANAIAVLDLDKAEFTGVYPLGLQDYSQTKVDLQKDKKIDLTNYENVYGIKMPDGISVTIVGGKTYLLTANEGDSRADWAGLDNEVESKDSPTGNVKLDEDVVWFNAKLWDGLDTGKAYIFGGRSFSLYEVTDAGLTLVYDSGSDFEEITAKQLPDYFNCSNDKIKLDNRSGKKGPEPESVTVGTVNGKTYAFVALERIGGVMVYDITDPANATFVNYINSRDFSNKIAGDVSPEGLCFVSAAGSKTGSPLLLAACEVSGTLAVYELSYSISAVKSEHGSVTVSPRYAEYGDTVTVTVKPDSGYALETVTVTDSKGNELKMTDKGGGKYTFTMPSGKVEVKATFMDDNTMLNFFMDVPANSYYYDAVLWAAQKDITGGTDAEHFSPNASCERGQLVTFLWRAAGKPVVNYAMSFSDVSGAAYYTEAVRWAASLGIVSGYGDGRFGVNDPITREQMAVMLYRFAKAQGMDTTQGGMAVREFDDFEQVSAYAGEAMAWAVNTGILKGANNQLMPKASCTRAQIVTMLHRLLAD